MDSNDIIDELKVKIKTQDYSKKSQIEGVKLIDLADFPDDGGAFVELARLDDAGGMLAIPEFKIKQINRSEMEPSSVKAFHLHYNQDDVWFVPPADRLLVGLVDTRKGSPTTGAIMRFVLGANKSRLLFIPRGVAHGVANLSNKTATLMYFVNQHFNAGKEPARQLAIRFGSRLYPVGLHEAAKKQTDGVYISVKRGGTMIEYEDEDREIRRRYEAELSRQGVPCRMPG